MARNPRLARPLAAEGDARAQYVLGLIYYNGRGVAQDYNEAMTEDGSLIVLSRPDTKCARAYWYVLDELLERIGGPAQPLVRSIVTKMKQEDGELEEERRSTRKTVQKGA